MPDTEAGGLDRCPGVETLAAFVDRRLDAPVRAEVTAHLAGCERCYELIAELMHTQEALSASAAPPGDRSIATIDRVPAPPAGRRTLYVFGGSALAVAATLLLVFLLPGGSSHEGRVRPLVDAVGERRTYEGRLTGGFRYGELRTPTRSGTGDLASNVELLAAAGALQRAAEEAPTAANLHAWGIAEVLLGRVEPGVATLEDAAAADPSNAALQSDLAAAYIERARRLARDEDWPRAIHAAETALQADSDLLEARFNRAVALDALGLREPAIEAWREYLEHDHASGWAEAARQALAKLEGQRISRLDDAGSIDESRWRELVESNAQPFREYLEDTLLPAWAGSIRTGDLQAAAQHLSRARRGAEALRAGVGDQLPMESVRAIDSTSCPPGVHAEAYGLWEQGRRQYMNDQMAAMTLTFTRAAGLFGRCRSPQEYWARHYLIVGGYYAGRLDEADAALDRLRADAGGRGYAALEARLTWDAGTLDYQRARFERAAIAYADAQSRFARIAEPENEAVVTHKLAEAYARLGQYERSWEEGRRALARIDLVRDPRWRYSMLAGAGTMAMLSQLSGTASVLFRAALPAAYELGAPGAIVGTHQNLARALAAAGAVSEGWREIEVARRYVSSITDPGLAARFGADLLTAEAHLALKSDPARAVTLAERALQEYQSISSEYRLAALHLTRARGKRASGDLSGAAAALDEGLRYLESKRAVTSQIDLRVSYVDSVWELFSDAVHLHAVDLGQPAEGLAYAERARARTLLESSAGAASMTPVDPGEVALALAPDDAMLYLLTHESETLAWVLRRDAAPAFVRLAIGQREADRLIARLRKTLQAGHDAEALGISRGLWTQILAPLESSLRGASRLIVVADGHWQQLPFAGLQNPETGRFLIEDVTIVTAPSASVYASLVHRTQAASSHRRASIFAAPGSNASDGGLGVLPYAAAEAEAVAAVYRSHALHMGSGATAARLLESLQHDDVVHFAGHAVADAMSPWQSRLVMNAGTGQEVSLTAMDIAATPARARVVVLAACRTADGPMSRGEGLMSLARPFIVAGVRSVVATLWDVQDRQAAAMSERFHRELVRTGDAAIALQRAQVLAIQSSRTRGLGIWSGYVVVGA